jgi:hypothetical protein
VASHITRSHLLAGCFYLLLARKRKCSEWGSHLSPLVQRNPLHKAVTWLEGERFAAGEQVFSLRLSSIKLHQPFV